MQSGTPLARSAPLMTVESTQRFAPLTSFFGRQQEIASLREFIESGSSLITITGPGGVGKTRLVFALHAEMRKSGRFLDGSAFVPLAGVGDEALVIATIAHALGVLIEDESSPIDRLIEALRERSFLLVLDNLEHVLGSALEIARLHAGCPGIVIVCTSRRALRLIGEQEFPLTPLPIRAGGFDDPATAAESSPAIALFLARANSANPSFGMDHRNAPAIVEICSRLDGLPLAIELAAARTKLMSPQALLGRLSGKLQLLTSGPRDVPRRQQTLRDTISWSYELLLDEEKRLFRTISIFAGGASLDAIVEVAGAISGLDEIALLELTTALVDHSLLVQDRAEDGEPRFRMLETIREFGVEQLEAAGEGDAARDAHADYFVRIAAVAAEREYGYDEGARIAKLEADLDNIRAALVWLLEDEPYDSPRSREGLKLAGSMIRFWDVRGFLQEERRWLVRALERVAPAATPERGIALTGLGVNAWFMGDLETAKELQHDALAIWRELGDNRAIVRSLWFIGLVAGKRGDAEQLRRLAAECAPLTPTFEVTLWQAVPGSLLALAALTTGDFKECERLLGETAIYHQMNGFRWPEAWVLWMLAVAASELGEHARSLELKQRSLSLFHEHGDIYATLDSLTNIANSALQFGQAEIAATLLGRVLQHRTIVGQRITWSTFSEEEMIVRAQAALTPEQYEQARVRGKSMSIDEAVAAALAVQPFVVAPTAPAHVSDAFGLSPRELEVLRELVQGKSNEEIGGALFISPRTAGTHVANILGKLGVHSRAAAVAAAARAGLLN